MPTPSFDPSQPFESVAPPFDPSKPFETGDTSKLVGASAPLAKEKPATGLLSPITDIPREMADTTASTVSSAAHNLNPFSDERKAAMMRGDVMQPLLDTGKGILSAASTPLDFFVNGPARSLLGHPLAGMMPTATPEEQQRLRSAGATESIIPRSSSDENYARAKEGVDEAIAAMRPSGIPTKVVPPPGLVRGPYEIPATSPSWELAKTPLPAAPNQGPLGVTLSRGQETGELPLIQREQQAIRGPTLGDSAHDHAQQFVDQQRQQVANAAESVSKRLDPYGQVIAETPQEAGRFASEGVQDAAANAKAGVTQAYDTAKSLPGEIHAGAFEGIGQKIKGDLSLRDDPIVIDDKLTPFASHAIKDVEDRIANLQIQNRADPFGQPDPANITGVSLRGVDQMRRRLSAFRKDAYGSGNAADGRAASAVIDSFDRHVDSAINGGLFNGDPMAVQAWNDARAAHADYKSTFSAGKNDPVGRVVEKIIGTRNNPAAIPNDVADFMYGGSGINPSSLNVGVAKRVRSILGEQSPEWSGVKQGLFQRIVDPGPGVTDWGPGKIAQRINKFLNVDGLELSKEVFSPQERQLIQQYGDLQRKLEVPQSGANWSNTSTVLAPMLRKMSGGLASIVGAVIGHTVAPGLYGAGELAGAAAVNKMSKTVSDVRNLKKVSAQMPLVADSMKKWQKAYASAMQANSPQSAASLAVAGSNLARNLGRIGVNPNVLMQIQGTVPGRAQDQQQP